MAEVEESVYGIITDYLTPDKWEQLIRLYFEKLGATLIEIPAKMNPAKKVILILLQPLKHCEQFIMFKRSSIRVLQKATGR